MGTRLVGLPCGVGLVRRGVSMAISVAARLLRPASARGGHVSNAALWAACRRRDRIRTRSNLSDGKARSFRTALFASPSWAKLQTAQAWNLGWTWQHPSIRRADLRSH